MQPWAEKFYKSKQWQSCRALCISKAGGLCERCAKQGRITAAVIAHHLIPVTKDTVDNPEITLNLDNLEALCINCHNEVHRDINRKVRRQLYTQDPTKRRDAKRKAGRRYWVDKQGCVHPIPGAEGNPPATGTDDQEPKP